MFILTALQILNICVVTLSTLGFIFTFFLFFGLVKVSW